MDIDIKLDKLRPINIKLLHEVILKRRKTLLPVMDSLGIIKLSEEFREELREAVAEEFCEAGLNENDEPNKRGLLLEELIDSLWYF